MLLAATPSHLSNRPASPGFIQVTVSARIAVTAQPLAEHHLPRLASSSSTSGSPLPEHQTRRQEASPSAASIVTRKPSSSSTISPLPIEYHNYYGTAVHKKQPHSLSSSHNEGSTSRRTMSMAQAQARDRIRPVDCPWKDCDATLASINIFKKHLHKHYKRALAIAQEDESPNVFTWLRCEWDNCSDEDSWSIKDLERHVLKVHVKPLRKATCPFAGCPHIGSINDPNRHFLLQHANDQDSLTLPLCAEPRLANALEPLLPPPIPPHLVNRDFGLTPEVLPFQPRSDNAKDGIAVRRVTQDGPRMRDMTNTIGRISNGPFDPTGDAPIWYSLEVQSSSIFKPTVLHNRSLSDEHIRDHLRSPSGEVKKTYNDAGDHIKREATGELEESSAHMQNPWTTLVPPIGSLSTSSLSIRKRPAMDLQPQVAVSAGIQAGWKSIGKKRKCRDQDCGEEADVVGRQQSSSPTKDDGGASPIMKRFAPDRIFSASSRRAASRTGHSFGFPFWMERIEFEKRGRELGEL